MPASLADFYKTVASLSFTLLGLWWVVIQLRYKDGRGAPADRRHAYGVLLFFMTPGVMGLLAVVDAQASGTWRTVFFLVAALGLAEIVLYLLSTEPKTTATLALRCVGLVDYVGIALVALAPGIVAGAAVFRPLKVEAFLKNNNKGHMVKKSAAFTHEQIERFLLEASDDANLHNKVILLLTGSVPMIS